METERSQLAAQSIACRMLANHEACRIMRISGLRLHNHYRHDSKGNWVTITHNDCPVCSCSCPCHR